LTCEFLLAIEISIGRALKRLKRVDTHLHYGIVMISSTDGVVTSPRGGTLPNAGGEPPPE
jgi:hypothetical protein